ncbi:MAG: hypothetical protein WC358_06890 [Ignavibacteria bacterium]
MKAERVVIRNHIGENVLEIIKNLIITSTKSEILTDPFIIFDKNNSISISIELHSNFIAVTIRIA